MKLKETTLALLCMAFCFTSVVSAVDPCHGYSGFKPSDNGSPETCTGPNNNVCISYKDFTTGKFTRRCSEKNCEKLGLGSCTSCNSNSCNGEAFPDLTCQEYKGPSSTAEGNPKKCTLGMTCLMYKEKNNYIRTCGEDKITDCSKLDICTACYKNNCNKDPFISVCHSYSGPSTTDLGIPTLCKSGTCLSYKTDKNYVRDCHNMAQEVKLEQNPCTTDNCNHIAFSCKCYEYEGTDKTEKGAGSKSCLSGRCIMYKDTKTHKYIRGCVDDKKTCLANKETATQCAECTSENCNSDAFNTGSTFSLDVRMAAIALAGSMMILRSL